MFDVIVVVDVVVAGAAGELQLEFGLDDVELL